MSLIVAQPGLLSLLQDNGRFGAHNIGLTTGGPLDQEAFNWANRLLGNDANACCIEASFGGLQLEAQVDTYIAVTGADMPLQIDGVEMDRWTSHKVTAGSKVSLGFAQHGTRSYVAVAGGLQTPETFGSRSTVVREKIGGIAGAKLTDNDILDCEETNTLQRYTLLEEQRPQYPSHVKLNVVLGYQEALFDQHKKQIFFTSTYTMTDRADRMGMRLEGPNVACGTSQMLSEGICHGAIQIPADGQPIILINDRQTIGGYPKIGSVMAQDTARLAQLRPGNTVEFCAIDIHDAHNLNALAAHRFQRTQLHAIDG